MFCRKLRLEDINDLNVDYSKECFFTAEQYIRWLRKTGIKDNDKIAEHLLDMCYMKYKDILINIYNQHKNSDDFLRNVHNALGALQYDRIDNILNKQSMPLDINKKGFIHVIADNENSEKEVWWGEKRFGEK